MKKGLISVAIILLLIGYALFADGGERGTDTLTLEQEGVAKEEEKEQKKLRYAEEIVVTAYRLPADEVKLSSIPASITIISKEEMERKGVSTLQELFQQYSGFIVFDQVGNGVESIVDLRGFNEGTATTVVIDGVRLNEPDDNRVNFDLIPIDQIEQIEIVKGSSSPIYGEGSMAGIINIITRKGSGRPKLNLGFAMGSFNRRKYKASAGGSFKKLGFFLSGTKDKAEGFRENGYYKMNSLFSRLGYQISDTSTFNFSYMYNDNSFGNPGALTSAEMEQDRKQAPFNMVDDSSKNHNLITLNYQLNLQEKFTLAANIFHRNNKIDTLTTGRMAAIWGGFLTTSDINSRGGALQITYSRQLGEHTNTLAAGLEVTDNDFGADGFITNSQGENPFMVSSNLTDQSVRGFFLQDSFAFKQKIIFTLGGRYDQESFNYNDLLLSINDNSKDFSQWSMKLGAIYKLSDNASAFSSYSEAFLAPTVIDLFAYPLFGSNPDLKPTISKDYELGVRGSMKDRLTASFTWYRITVKDEIVYVFDFFTGGRNENVGRSLRQGIEFSLKGRITDWINGYLYYSFTDAKIKSGENIDNKIPLVPAHKLNFGAQLSLSEKLILYAEGIRVGEQYLSGDDQNSQKPIKGYTLLNARLSYRLADLEVWLKINNLLNQQYSTRGIYIAGAQYFTPAPGINFNLGINYTF